MVKGVSRRVVVVQPDAHGLFEQAIFLVRDYTVPRGDVVREACRIGGTFRAVQTAFCVLADRLRFCSGLHACERGLVGDLAAGLTNRSKLLENTPDYCIFLR